MNAPEPGGPDGLLAAFRARLRSLGLPPGSALVAVSGGTDSLALLELLRLTRDDHGLDLVVGHVDHGIHPDSAAIADRVRAAATAAGLPCEVARLELGPGTGETEARAARYEALRAMRTARAGGVICTAHHQDDQVETVLLRVLAGSGPAGLAAMAARTGDLVRPLLWCPRAALRAWAAERGIAGWEDPANRDPVHDRSWLRVDILPRLRARRPDLDRRLAGLAAHARDEREAWNGLLEVLPDLALREEWDAVSVAAVPLRGYHSPLARSVVRAVARRAGCVLGMGGAERALQLVQRGRSGARVDLGARRVAELAFDRFRILRAPLAEEVPATVRLAGMDGTARWGRWSVRWRREPAPDAVERVGWVSWFTPATLTLRAWQPGDRLHPLGGTGRRLVVRCLQEARIPATRRSAWPVLEDAGGHPVWIPGVCRGREHVPPSGTEALRVDVELS